MYKRQVYCRENEKFLSPAGGSRLHFEPEAVHILMDYNWPGNVRELENAIERAVVLATSEEVPASVLPEQVLQSTGVRTTAPGPDGKLPAGASLFEIVADFERRIIIEALEPVSYTHLDVYKRQIQASFNCTACTRAMAAARCPKGSSTSVSSKPSRPVPICSSNGPNMHSMWSRADCRPASGPRSRVST